MKSMQKVKFAIRPVPTWEQHTTPELIHRYLNYKVNFQGQFLLLLAKALKVSYELILLTQDYQSQRLPNGTWTGVIGMMHRKEIDVMVQFLIHEEVFMKEIDFCYPFALYGVSFASGKPVSVPTVFGMIQILSSQLWMAIAGTFVTLAVMYFVVLKSRYSFSKVLLHVLAVLLRQSTIIVPSKWAENLLIYSWVAGAMFLCLTFDSGVLSFLAFPPQRQIKNIEELANAALKGDVVCLAPGAETFGNMLLRFPDPNHKIIGQNLLDSIRKYSHLTQEAQIEKSGKTLAFILDSFVLPVYKGRYIVSEEQFMEKLSSISVRKGFCCKKQIDDAIHRIMDTGLYKKVQDDHAFFASLLLFREYFVPVLSKTLNLENVAPAFVILLLGYVASLITLAYEILSNRKNKVRCKKIVKKNNTVNRINLQKNRRKI